MACIASSGAALGDDSATLAAIAVPAGHRLALRYAASGAQVYRCKAVPSDASGYAWTLVGPDATLTDEQGKAAGRHYTGPTWETPDGGKVTGKVLAKSVAPDGASIPWLLLAATPAADPRAFANVDFIQRIETHGGTAPAGGCTRETLDAQTRVAYVAQYLFYTKN